jgi:outer membrane protein
MEEDASLKEQHGLLMSLLHVMGGAIPPFFGHWPVSAATSSHSQGDCMKSIIALVLAIIVVSTPVMAAPPEKIGVVDLQRAVSASKEGVAARNDIMVKTEQLNNKLKTIQAEFAQLKAELEKDGATMKAEVRAEKEQQLLQKARDFQKRQRDAQEEIKQMEEDSLQKLVAKMAGLMGKIGDEGGYAVILEQSAGVRYFNKSVDITPLLVQKADQLYKN